MAHRLPGCQLEGDMLVALGRVRPAGLSRLSVRRRRRGDLQQRADPDREPAGGRRQWRGDLPGVACRSRRPRPGRRRPRSSSAWRRPAAARSSASWCCRWRPRPNLIGIKPLFGDKNVAEGDKAEFDVVFVAPDGKQLPRNGLRYELLKMESRYQWYRQNSSWEYEPVKSTSRVADGDLTLDSRQGGARQPGAAARPLSPRRQIIRRRRADHLGAVRRRLVFRRQRRHA